jgi:uncharacterized membrane protein YeaQ/YmgE (transglycosylase-associated protein family)
MSSSVIIDLIVLMLAGIIGGNAAGTSLPKYDLGRIWNTIIGAAGGAVGGEVLQTVMQFVGGRSEMASVITPLVAGGASGAVLTMLIATLKGPPSNN